ncbi:UvrD-helicase domain-containing protein [Sinorhizobium fredii]|uniref:UvrD-helicase domain-containing protein n=1 Tax=Rhizobium fredii TaxID=380 RepID=UPI0004B330F4|nr:UvrD-helicase domain-containing protein [Sinorhizobium fredii]
MSKAALNSELFVIPRPFGLYRDNRIDRGAIADLVRAMVRSRRGVSRISVCEWILGFVEAKDIAFGKEAVEGVIDLLCDAHDIGSGTIREEPVLFALPERRIAMPSGQIIGLGDHGQMADRERDRLFPSVSGPATSNLIDVFETWDDLPEPSRLPFLAASGNWTAAAAIPPALRRALSLCGSFDPESGSWSIGEENANFLNDWFGTKLPETEKYTEAAAEAGPDAGQFLVSAAPADSRLTVEAGPGAGKTHTACERVARLIEGGLASSKIVLLSFTRIAVAEIRARITDRLSHTANGAGVQVHTFDSFASKLLAAATSRGAGSYEANIRSATQLLRSGDPLVTNIIDPLEHIIIDEAQDLVGLRREFCTALIDLAHPSCGITIFGDFAQAIYGYRSQGSEDDTLLNTVTHRPDFKEVRLEHDHRTRTDALRTLFTSARDVLRSDRKGSRERFFEVRTLIETASSETGISNFQTHPSTTRGLILTRYKANLLEAAEALRVQGRDFRIRLPDRPLRIEPWIGASLGGLDSSTRISRGTFEQLYNALVPKPPRDWQDCWEILVDLDGSDRDDIVVGHVAESLEDPPLELVSDHEGSFGPLLSTIHGIKGHQAERVLLLLTAERRKDNVNWGEEARILYVGATRASHELRTGWVPRANFYTKGKPERHWRPRSEYRELEIGLEGDILGWSDFKRAGHVASAQATIAAIWRAADSAAKADAIPDAEGALLVHTTGGGLPLGQLSPQFAEILRSISQKEPDSDLPRLSGISIVGATTVVVPGRTADPPTLALMPLLGGFAKVPR